LGSVIALTDSVGAIETTNTYEPFGRTEVEGTSTGNPTMFTGREAEPGSLYYYRARYYDSMLQRFISEDPSGLSAGINLYTYADNNPVSFRDPFGLQAGLRPDSKEKWNDAWNVGPYDALRGKTLADQSFEDAKRTGLPGAGNGLQDAYRHCLWSCRMTQELGFKQAKLIADEHENAGDRNGQKPWERKMDEANNDAGRNCASGSSPDGKQPDCAAKCMELLRNGRLFGPGGIPFQVWLGALGGIGR
jgi:RHS repeat-associated protein